MDKLRADFEDAWVADNSSTPEAAEIRREALRKIWHINENGEGAYFDSFVMWAWKWWQASRASIVVELPQRQSLCASGYGDGYFVPSDYGDGLEYDETVEALRSIGLSIKGDRV